MTSRPDPFAAAFSNFTPRPGARVSITPDVVPDSLESDVTDEWLSPPTSSRCPSIRFLDKRRTRVDFWHVDFFGRPRQLLDGINGGVVEKDADLDRYMQTILRALSFSFERYR